MSGSVSMVDGHIDPDKKGITPQQAIKYFEDEVLMLENAPSLNGCEMTDEWREQLEICKMAKQAIEKQIPKKLDGKDEDDLVRGCHKCSEVNALWKMNGDRNRYCGNCGQAIDWSDTE